MTLEDAKNDLFPPGCILIKYKNIQIIKGFWIRSRFFNFSFFSSFCIFNATGKLGIPIDRGHDANAFGVGTSSGGRTFEEKSGKYLEKISTPFFGSESDRKFK